MKLRRLWKLLSGVALLVTGLLLGVSAPTAASTGGCAGDVVVALDVAVWSRPGHDTYGFTLSEPLPAGEWRVATSSSDDYWGRSESSQSQEQWLLDITDHRVLGPTSDLVDGVESASTTDRLGSFVSQAGVSHFTVRHAASSTPAGTNSVTADCVSFTRVTPPPTTTTSAPSTTSTTTSTVPSTSTTSTPPTTTTGPPTTSSTTTTTTTSTTTTSTLPPVTVAPPTTSPTTVAPKPPPTTVPPPKVPDIVASVSVDCAADRVYVLLGNDGSAGATVDVALPLAAVESGLEVGEGATTTSTLDIGDLDGATEIRISDSATGETYLRTPIDIDCSDPARPTASTVLDCATDVLVVVLGNEAGDSAELTVVHERVAIVAEVEVAAGDTLQVEVPLDGVASVPIRVLRGDGTDVVRVEVENICPPSDPDPTDGEGDGPVPGESTDDPDSSGNGDGATGTPGSCAASVMAAPECAEIRVVVEPDCPRSLANVSLRREGIGRERLVVLVDGVVAGVVAIDGSGQATLPVSLGGSEVDLAVSRSTSNEPISAGTLSCDSKSSRAGPIAASLVVFAVISTAAGVMPWPIRPGPG